MAESLTKSQLLVKYGFIKDKYRGLYKLNKKKTYYVPDDGASENAFYNPEHAAEEMDEEVNLISNNQYYKTGFPKPNKRFRMIDESFNKSLEEMYFWSINHARVDQGFPELIKITDIFSASENSAFFGQSAQRLSIQEDRASNFLRGISELVKTLFQIVRELRIIDERLEIYHTWRKSKSADSTLKGLFTDFAENKGGQMQPGSVYHLSNQVGYAVLPDLFFNTIIYEKSDVDSIVAGLDFNNNVKAVLKRKLYQFIVWKEKTEVELEARRKFQIKYLRQHYTVIKSYMSWVKPYLKHINRLTMDERQLDSPDLISSFETSATEIEVLAVKPLAKNKYRAVMVMHYFFTTRPILQYNQDYQKGPVHVGRGRMTLRSYAWTQEQIDSYRRMKDNEDRELLGMVDDQLKAAMEMLGKDLEDYLEEAEASIDEKNNYHAPLKKDKLKAPMGDGSILEPFIELFKGFWDIGTLLIPKGFGSKSSSSGGGKGDPVGAIKKANAGMWLVYKNYKKANKMLSW